jgi:hypothetical protein
MSVKILSGEIFILMFIKELCGGVHKHEYPYHVVSLHLVSVNVMRQLKSVKGIFFFTLLIEEEWSKTRRCSITTAFQLWFRICH